MGFLDGLSKKSAEISSSLQESMNKSQRESRCKKTINENKSKIEKIYFEIGKKVYETREVNEELMTYINTKIEEIDTMSKENEELRKEVLLLNNKKLCPNCGAEVDINTTFCPQCGKEQEKIEVEPFIPNGKRKCSGCGEIIDDKNVFCPKCGAKKEVADEEKEDSAVASEKVVPEGKRKCSGCGEIIDDSDMFCANCGTKKEDK
ncbi:MAG: zinc ribbon domain-containing protein [Clostridia bacterium]